ncbi:YciI family protein [Saccharomonospora xinjiangensis]|uniref:YciI family protein n=1 Tax=Saccharomonospora xinjiangensis TaxID=75294 RepID=UPI0035103598
MTDGGDGGNEGAVLHLMRVRYTGSEDDAAPFVAAHVEYLRHHHDEGTFVVSGQTVPSPEGGAIVACGVDRATVEAIAARDPFVAAGVAEYSITSIEVGRVHPALAALLT